MGGNRARKSDSAGKPRVAHDERALSNKVLMVDGDRCTGCKVCELACSMAKVGEYNPAKSLISILQNRELHVNIPAVSVQCDFCGECVRWCFDGAISIIDFSEAVIGRRKMQVGKFPAPVLSSREPERGR